MILAKGAKNMPESERIALVNSLTVCGGSRTFTEICRETGIDIKTLTIWRHKYGPVQAPAGMFRAEPPPAGPWKTLPASVHIALGGEYADFIRSQIEAGHADTPSEVVRQALVLMRHQVKR